MADEFIKSVEDGLNLSKRIYFGKDRSVAPPKPISAMEKSTHSYLPTAPMIYAVIPDPTVVDNPDIPSYQPHVHGRCDPPALIPLQMNGISIEADCYLDTAFVTVSGSWRVHCVMRNHSCECRIAVPMGEQGSILGVEVDAPMKSYSTKLITMDEDMDTGKITRPEDGGFLKPHIFTFTIPLIDGGCNLSLKVRWSQKLMYQDGQLNLTVPFCFPEYVTPAGKKMAKKEKIQLNINSGPGTEVSCKTISHPLKELRREGGRLGFLYESQVLTWSSTDFIFTYGVSTNSSANVILQSPSVFDIDRREMFCFYMFPGSNFSKKAFKKDLLFVVDISGSMRGKPLDDTKSAVTAALSKLDPGDSFNIIAFNDETYLFSSSLELATGEAIEKATEWIGMNFVSGGGTNISLPLNKAVEMLSSTRNSIPIIFLITDGAVEDERHICDIIESHLTNSGSGSISPRLYTFGIGSFCNHYFLRTLAVIGRGRYSAAYDADSVEIQMTSFFGKAFSTILANLSIGGLDNLDELEVYPSCVPDLLSESPFIISGRYSGSFPSCTKIKGILSDMSNITIDLKLQEAKDIPLDEVLAKQEIELHTAQAWASNNKELDEKWRPKGSVNPGNSKNPQIVELRVCKQYHLYLVVIPRQASKILHRARHRHIAKLSEQYSVISEYTHMILLEKDEGKNATTVPARKQKEKQFAAELDQPKTIRLPHPGLGFGNLTATVANARPGKDEFKLPESSEMFIKAASNCCSAMCGRCCCMCCIQTCSRMNDQSAVVLAQLCTAFSWLGCYSCCDACCDSNS